MPDVKWRSKAKCVFCYIITSEKRFNHADYLDYTKLTQLLPTCVNSPEAKEGTASVMHQCSCITLQTNSEPTKTLETCINELQKFMKPRRDSLNSERWIMRPKKVAESVNAERKEMLTSRRERPMIQRPPKCRNSHLSPKNLYKTTRQWVGFEALQRRRRKRLPACPSFGVPFPLIARIGNR
jgi:hypothetical protein